MKMNFYFQKNSSFAPAPAHPSSAHSVVAGVGLLWGKTVNHT